MPRYLVDATYARIYVRIDHHSKHGYDNGYDQVGRYGMITKRYPANEAKALARKLVLFC